MLYPLNRTAVVFLLMVGLAPVLSAQVTLSFLEGDQASAASATGQSFTPSDAGVFPTSSAFLTQMQFQSGIDAEGAVYLDIYSNLSSGNYTGYVGSSFGSQVWTPGTTLTWDFDDLELDKDTTYFAVFSSDAVDGGVVNRGTRYYSSNVYSGGSLIYSNNLTPSLDAGFSATFNTTAVPEPSTYAALCGLAVFGFMLMRRRRG